MSNLKSISKGMNHYSPQGITNKCIGESDDNECVGIRDNVMVL
jgi:hypothetical protein